MTITLTNYTTNPVKCEQEPFTATISFESGNAFIEEIQKIFLARIHDEHTPTALLFTLPPIFESRPITVVYDETITSHDMLAILAQRIESDMEGRDEPQQIQCKKITDINEIANVFIQMNIEKDQHILNAVAETAKLCGLTSVIIASTTPHIQEIYRRIQRPTLASFQTTISGNVNHIPELLTSIHETISQIAHKLPPHIQQAFEKGNPTCRH